MKVRIYHLTKTGEEELGAIVLKDGHLVTDPPDSRALRNLLSIPLQPYHPTEKPKMIDAVEDPEGFLRALPEIYRGTYSWAGPLEE